VLDKNGEQLISAHLDRTIATIDAAMKDGDRFVVAAHSLGSVVAHNYVVRQWTSGSARLPDTVVTFGSPIGLLTWIWLFLDFENMDFRQRVPADHYFCWNPVSSGKDERKTLSWINAVNCVDPIATAFPAAAVDLSATQATLANALKGGSIAHRFFGSAKIGAVGAAHNQYLNDTRGFVKILLRASGLAAGDAEDVPGVRSALQHWTATQSVLRNCQSTLLGIAIVAIGLYCGAVARAFHDRRVRCGSCSSLPGRASPSAFSPFFSVCCSAVPPNGLPPRSSAR
jgi:hypothetical protein